MSSTNKTAELQLSQFVGTDIPSILTDYNGDMRKIDAGVLEVKQATAGAVSDLSSVTARVTNAEQSISGLNSTVQGIATRVVTVESLIPANASAQNKLITAQDIPEIPSIESLEDRVGNIENDVENITTNVSTLSTNVNALETATSVVQDQMKSLADQYEGTVTDVLNIQQVIPNNASTSNKLATMADVGGGSSLTLALSIADGRTPTQAEITAISNFIATYGNNLDKYAFFARIAKSATESILPATVSISNNRIEVSTVEPVNIVTAQIEQQFSHASIGASNGSVNCVSLTATSSGVTLTDVGLGLHNVEIYAIGIGE